MKLIIYTLLFFVVGSASPILLSNEMETRASIEKNVRLFFMGGKFNELDILAKKYRENKERTSSGVWKLTIFYYAINKLAKHSIKREDYWDFLKTRADDWITKYPDSVTAKIIKGIILQQYAWKFRGGSWSYKVPLKAWKPFKENLMIANKYMINIKKDSVLDPHWYDVMANIKKELGGDNVSFIKFIEEGLDKFPDYYQLYFTAIDYLAPKWHGDKEKIEEFANKAVKRTKNNEGMAMYARIYWFASQTQYNEMLFLESNVVWDKMKKGIYDVIKKYPDSWNLQNFAFFSCLVKDKETSRMLFDKMSSPMIKQIWKNHKNYEYCKEMAYLK